jgi:lipid A ethanolaminephosphotransferase
MLRNVVATDVREARDLVVGRMAPYLLAQGLLPIALLLAVRLRRDPWRRSVRRRAGALLAALGLAAAGGWSAMHELTPLLRERKALRYLVNPGSAVYSLLAVVGRDVRSAETPRRVVGADATLAPRPPGARPRALVLVVGETVRADNWGLGGYARQTTPRLAARPDVIDFPRAVSCGTSTEVSVPCMFSADGRRRYDEDRIRGSESLLHVLSRAGVEVLWRDNQSGCKGVCAGLPYEVAGRNASPDLCGPEGCLDEVLLDGLRERIDAARGDLMIVLHAMGNHGPAYFARYPPSFRRFEPTCDTTDLAACSREAVVNSYDNAVTYTDDVLARAIETLDGVTSHDVALLYASDHGESLGERGLFLHGVPFVIAPREQTAIPFVAWLSRDLRRSLDVDDGCLERRAAEPVSHDNLFSTVLGLYDVRSAARERELDVFAACRG